MRPLLPTHSDRRAARALILGRAVRLAALLWLLTQSALAAAALVNVVATESFHPHDGVSTPTTAGEAILLLCPGATLVLLVRGHRTWAKITAAVASRQLRSA